MKPLPHKGQRLRQECAPRHPGRASPSPAPDRKQYFPKRTGGLPSYLPGTERIGEKKHSCLFTQKEGIQLFHILRGAQNLLRCLCGVRPVPWTAVCRDTRAPSRGSGGPGVPVPAGSRPCRVPKDTHSTGRTRGLGLSLTGQHGNKRQEAEWTRGERIQSACTVSFYEGC